MLITVRVNVRFFHTGCDEMRCIAVLHGTASRRNHTGSIAVCVALPLRRGAISGVNEP